MIINRHTDLYGVLGFPLSQTLGPIMHNTAFEVTGVNAVYLAFETGDIEGCVKGMRALGIKGMSVTLPFKSEVLPYLDGVDEMAKKIGAVNTIVNKNGQLIGYNTDALGSLKALQDVVGLTGMNCLLLGAGGAARAIGFILKEQGVHLTIANRSPERGIALARSLHSPFVLLKDVGKMDEDILIQATPVGMYPHKDQCLIPEYLLKEGMVVMDIIYNPPETRLVKTARKRGCRTITGLTMFVYQGAEQFRLWTDINPPISAMKRAVKEALNIRDE
ncbi:MAG: shikimate dehydrogenase [Desulfobacterales bacterium]|nr:shikimate dehydrogenase [Desulfobacterales bacterium]